MTQSSTMHSPLGPQTDDERRCFDRGMEQWRASLKRPDMTEEDRVKGALEAYCRQAFALALSPPLKAGEAGHIANCCICGRVVDTRERTEGGDAFGVELEDGRWTCSMECWDSAVGDAHPIKAGEVVPVGWILPQRLDAPFQFTAYRVRGDTEQGTKP